MFQTSGPTLVKDLSPKVLKFFIGLNREIEFADLKFLLGLYGVRSSLRYGGKSGLYRHWWTRVAILYSILAATGSQSNDLKSGKAASLFRLDRISHAALFCKRCEGIPI